MDAIVEQVAQATRGQAAPIDVDILIIGAGFSGLAAALEARRFGYSRIIILEKAQELGGTWRENTYPGIACDIPSHLYSFARHPKADWSHAFSGGAEILDYLKKTAKDNNLTSHIHFGEEVTRADWDGDVNQWVVKTGSGSTYTGKALIAAPGPLHVPHLPDIKGLADFPGKVIHSARWDHSYAFAGRHVAVIGTGASAIQFVPEVAKLAQRVVVYQRTAPWVIPRLDHAYSPFAKWINQYLPFARRFRRGLQMVLQELRHAGFAGKPVAVRIGQKMAMDHLKRGVKDKELRRKLTPNYRIGCKRVLRSDDWYQTLTRPNVELVVDPIDKVEATGIRSEDGTLRPADVVLLGTGFEVSDTPLSLPICGRGGVSLAEAWSKGMQAHRGVAVPGFPNFFIVLGPNSGLGHNSVVLMAEAQVEHMLRVLKNAQISGLAAVEPRPEIFTAYNKEIQERLSSTVWQSGGCSSWYQDRNGFNFIIWPGNVHEYQRVMQSAGLEEYQEAV